MDVQLKVTVESTLKEAATLKAKAEGKTMKQLVEELLKRYVASEQEEVKPQPLIRKEQVEPSKSTLTLEQFESRLEYIDYLERKGLLY